MPISSLADIEAFEKLPLSEQPIFPNTYAGIQHGAAIDPEKVALRFFLQATHYTEEFVYPYKDLLGLITQAANMFHDLGVGKDDVVSMLLPNIPQAYFTIFGAQTVGIVNPINPLLEPEIIASLMNAAKTKVLVTITPFPRSDLWQKVVSIVQDVPSLETILQVDLFNYLSGVKRLGAKFLMWRQKSPQLTGGRVLDFGITAAKYPADRLISKREIQPDDTAIIFHTGGTTGIPKLAKQSHYNVTFDAWAASRNISSNDLKLDAEETIYCGLPLYHNFAFMTAGMIPFSFGSTVILGTPLGFRGEGVFDNFWAMMEYFRVTYFSAVPTVYTALLDCPIGSHNIKMLKYGLCGAAPMPVNVFNTFENRTGVKILEGYGLTESTSVASVNPSAGERVVGSIGLRIPYGEMRTAVIDANGNYVRDCEVDELGVVIIRGPHVFQGYLEERHNKELWLDTGDGQGKWLNTGDMGRMDAKQYFWLTGRKKEMIIRGGHNIDPLLIEEPLYKHPDVELVAAVGRLDAHAGEIPVAYVQLVSGSTTTSEELLAYAQQEIKERAAVPKAIYIVNKIPQTAVGKIFKPPLVQKEVQSVFTEELSEVAGIESVTVGVDADALHGMFARVAVVPKVGADTAVLKNIIDKKLGQYSIYYEITGL